METQGYLCDIHTKKMKTRMSDIHTKIKDTQGICVTFTQKRVGQFHSEKKEKRCDSPHKIRVMYKAKGNNKEVYS